MNTNYSNGHYWVPALTWILCQILTKERLVRHNVSHQGFRLIKATNINRYCVILIQDFELNWSSSPVGNLLQLFVVCCCWVIEPCLTLCDCLDCSLPGSSVNVISQTRILVWIAISFSRGIFLTKESNPSVVHCRRMLSTEPRHVNTHQ